LGIGGDDAMRTFAYMAIGVLIVCTLSGGTKALSLDTASMVIPVADMMQVAAPDKQDRAEEEEDLLNVWD
jgi:hypothetical protein